MDFKGQTRVYSSVIRHGFDAHQLIIIDEFEGDNEYSASKEMFWIRSFMTNYCKWPEMNGLNLSDGGEGFVGYKPTDEQRRKRSEWAKDYFSRNPSPNLGKKLSDDRKREISEWCKKNKTYRQLNAGKPRTKQHLDKMVATRRRNGSYTTSDATKKKMSQAHIARLGGLKPKRTPSPRIYGPISQEQKKKIQKPVEQYSADGVFIKEYDSVTSASIETGVLTPNIIRILKGRIINPKKYIFKYKQ